MTEWECTVRSISGVVEAPDIRVALRRFSTDVCRHLKKGALSAFIDCFPREE